MADEAVRRVGFIGLGRMGRPMAGHAAAAGYETIGWDVDAGAITAAEAIGCRPAGSLAECVREADAVIVIVPTDDDLKAACTDAGGIFASARPGTIVCACSSLLPETAAEMAEKANEHGLEFLDMPLTKGVRAAEAGTMTLLVGGKAEVLARLRPVLESFSDAIHHVGPAGAAQVAKSVNNILLWVGLEGALEALTLGRAYDLDVEGLRAALLDCSADSWVLRELQDIEPTWPAKDLENVARMAEAQELPMPLVERLTELAGGLTRQRITDLFRD